MAIQTERKLMFRVSLKDFKFWQLQCNFNVIKAFFMFMMGWTWTQEKCSYTCLPSKQHCTNPLGMWCILEEEEDTFQDNKFPNYSLGHSMQLWHKYSNPWALYPQKCSHFHMLPRILPTSPHRNFFMTLLKLLASFPVIIYLRNHFLPSPCSLQMHASSSRHQ